MTTLVLLNTTIFGVSFVRHYDGKITYLLSPNDVILKTGPSSKRHYDDLNHSTSEDTTTLVVLIMTFLVGYL